MLDNRSRTVPASPRGGRAVKEPGLPRTQKLSPDRPPRAQAATTALPAAPLVVGLRHAAQSQTQGVE